MNGAPAVLAAGRWCGCFAYPPLLSAQGWGTRIQADGGTHVPNAEYRTPDLWQTVKVRGRNDGIINAMTSLPRRAAVHPQNKSAAQEFYFRALDLIAEGRSMEAAALLRECVVLDSDFLDALHALTRALQDAGELDEAVLVAQRLIALDPDDVLAHTRLSILYQAKGMVPEAEAESTRAKLLGWKQQLRESRSDGVVADPLVSE